MKGLALPSLVLFGEDNYRGINSILANIAEEIFIQDFEELNSELEKIMALYTLEKVNWTTQTRICRLNLESKGMLFGTYKIEVIAYPTNSSDYSIKERKILKLNKPIKGKEEK